MLRSCDSTTITGYNSAKVLVIWTSYLGEEIPFTKATESNNYTNWNTIWFWVGCASRKWRMYNVLKLIAGTYNIIVEGEKLKHFNTHKLIDGWACDGIVVSN